MDIVEALTSLRPGAKWSYTEEGLEWLDTEQTEPTIEELQAEYDAQEYARNRAKEYPAMEDYLDGVVKGDQAQIDKYIADCLAVKEKYPK